MIRTSFCRSYLFVFVISFLYLYPSDGYLFDSLIDGDSCYYRCKDHIYLHSDDDRFEACARGCRFFDIAELIDTDNVVQRCTGYCNESYPTPVRAMELFICKTGCQAGRPHSEEYALSGDDDDDESDDTLNGINDDKNGGGDKMRNSSARDRLAKFRTCKKPRIKFRSLHHSRQGKSNWKGLPQCLVASLFLLLVVLGLLLGMLIEQKPEFLDKELKKTPPYLYHRCCCDEEAPPLPEKLPLA